MKTRGARVLTRSSPKSKFKTSTGVSGITRPSTISYWAIESGIADPVKAALELGRFPPMDVVGQVVSDWTVPQVMILVMVSPEAGMASLEATIRADEEAKRPEEPRVLM
jgi:hypothetical protein